MSSPRTIVTAADARFARTLLQLLLSAERYGAVPPAYSVVVFDLGLTAADRERIARRFPWCRVERFDFDARPPHVRRLEICAWKPAVVEHVLARTSGFVLWVDAASVIRAPLDGVFAQIARDGILALAGRSTIRRWCHESTLAALAATPEDAASRTRAAGVAGFDASRPAVRDLAAEWRRLAMLPDCIAPPGASRANHRYDQSLLGILLARAARRGAIRLTDDEIDVSSPAPVRWIATRQRVAPWVPLAFDPAVRAWYGTVKAIDRAVIRLKRTRPLRDAAFAGEDVLQRALAAAFSIRATARGRRFLRSKSDLRGRGCHCPPDLAVHLVHSEGLREGCDVVIDYGSNVEHPERPQIPLALVETVAAGIAAGETVHVKTDHIEAFARDILPRLSGPIVLVTGDSDMSPFPGFAHLLDDPRIAHWFAQNAEWPGDHPRLTRLPIGVDNPVYTKLEKRLGFAVATLLRRSPPDWTFSRNRMGDQARLQAVKRSMRRTIRDKPPRVLCTFHRNQMLIANADRIPDRAEALAAVRDHPDCRVIAERLPQEDYWRAHDDFAFELSPRGNGIDCFRTWECLFLETIPIVRTSPLDDLYRREGFPVVIVDSFREITTEALHRWKDERQDAFTPALVEKLTNDYWLRRIRAAAQRPSTDYTDYTDKAAIVR